MRPGDVLAGRFTILRAIARGGMGAVYEANDVMLRTRVALKVIRGRIATDALAMERLRREVLLARRVGHANVCRVYELYNASTSAGVPVHFLSMELLEGQTLAARIRQQGRLSPAEALPVVRQLCDGLQAAHAEGVIHRDFKSSNVMLVPGREATAPSRAVITDFGVARAVASAPGSRPEDPVTGESGILGTPEYMAPEQVTGGEVTPATDVYGLGVVMYEMVTGQLPFTGETPLSSAAKRLQEPAPPPKLATPTLDSRWNDVVLRCLAREPRHRFPSASAVVPALVGRRRRWLRPAAVFLTAVLVAGGAVLAARWTVGRPPAVRPAVAVLPFVDLSPARDQDYFSDGIAEEVLYALSQVEGLRVPGRTSSFFFKGKNEDLRTIAQKLNVTSVLEGSVRKVGDHIRITAELVNVADGYQLWSHQFDQDGTDVFAVQAEIARAVVNALKVKLLRSEATPAERRPGNPEAYRQLLLGRQFSRMGDIDRAALAYQKAVTLDPDYAVAWAELANPLFQLAWKVQDPGEVQAARQRAMAAAERAIALDPDLNAGYSARGWMRMHSWDWTGARADLERAYALSPNDAFAQSNYGSLLRRLGHLQEGLRHHRLAAELDPLNGFYWDALGDALLGVNQFEASRQAYQHALEIGPNSPYSLAGVASTYVLEHQPDAALSAIEKLTEEPKRLQFTAMAQHDLKHPKESQQALDAFIAKFGTLDPTTVAQIYAFRGEADRAFEWLERAYVARHDTLSDVLRDPYLASLHTDSRFKALVTKMKFPV